MKRKKNAANQHKLFCVCQKMNRKIATENTWLLPVAFHNRSSMLKSWNSRYRLVYAYTHTSHNDNIYYLIRSENLLSFEYRSVFRVKRKMLVVWHHVYEWWSLSAAAARTNTHFSPFAWNIDEIAIIHRIYTYTFIEWTVQNSFRRLNLCTSLCVSSAQAIGWLSLSEYLTRTERRQKKQQQHNDDISFDNRLDRLYANIVNGFSETKFPRVQFEWIA